MKKIISLIVMVAHFMYMAAPAAAFAHEVHSCRAVASVCIDGPSTKTINGVPVTKDCWEYQDRYECLVPNPVDACAVAKRPEAECVVEGERCISQENGVCTAYERQYSCEKDLKTLADPLPGNIKEKAHTHHVSSNWSSDCEEGGCRVTGTVCLQGSETRVINGVPVHKACWKEQRTLSCETGEGDDSCGEMAADPNCTFKGTKCTHSLPDGSCQIEEKVYSCVESEGRTETVSSCEDKDFAKTMSALEMAREMQRFYDPDTQRFFNGEANKCSVKLGGALDGLLGGNCCKTKAEPGKMKDFLIQAGTAKAVTHAVASVASHYTYTTMFVNSAAQSLGTALSAAGGITGSSQIGAFGFTASGAGGNLGTIVQFNPVVFASAIAVMALGQWLKCDQKEILTAMKRKAGLCHYVGSYCGKKVLGACVKKIESQCCYISKLAKLVNVGGRTQLGLGFGSSKNPSCEGFTAQELEKLDFSKIDLSEFYKDIVANMENVTKSGERAVKGAVGNITGGQNTPSRSNYYESN